MISYETAKNSRYTNGRRRVSRNTYMRRDGDDFVIKYHATDIIRIHPDGSYTIDLDGWWTVSTLARVREFVPVRLYSVKGTLTVTSKDDPLTPPKVQKCRTCHGKGTEHRDAAYSWYGNREDGTYGKLDAPRELYPALDSVCYRCKGETTFDYGSQPNPYRFFDGIVIKADGTVKPRQKGLVRLYTETAEDRKNARMRKRIAAYVAGYTNEKVKALYEDAAENGVAGNCLFCQMGQKYTNTDHLIDHMSEKYYMAMIMFNALTAKGYRSPAVIMITSPDLVRKAISEYFTNALVTGRANARNRKAA